MPVGMGNMVERDERSKLYLDYLRRIDTEQVLDYYGMDNARRIGDNIIHSCLIDRVVPHHANGDANPSASANVEKKVYHCYSYGGGDIFWFICQMEGRESFVDIVPLLGQFLGGGTLDTPDFLAEIEAFFAQPDPPIPAPVYHERILRNWALYHPYLRERGVTKEAAARLQLGYDEEGVRITIPHWVDGKLVGWQRRSLSDPRWPTTPAEPVFEEGKVVRYVDPPPKYKNTSNFPKADTIYNLDRVRERGHRRVVVVESPMSVAKCESLSADESDLLSATVSTFGAKIGTGQLDKLRTFDEVIVYMDGDEAGERGAYKLVDGLWRHTVVTHVTAEGPKDPADYDDAADLHRLLKGRSPAVLVLPELEKRYGHKRRDTRKPDGRGHAANRR